MINFIFNIEFWFRGMGLRNHNFFILQWQINLFAHTFFFEVKFITAGL